MLELSFLNYFIVFFKQDESLRHIERRHLKSHIITDTQRPNPNLVAPTPIGDNSVTVSQPRQEQSILEEVLYRSFNVDGAFGRHVKIFGSDSVIKTVCSKWAES